jgi:mannosyltransferase
MHRSSAWLLTGIILLGLGVRSYQLTTRSIWFDESFSWRVITQPVPVMLETTAKDVHPPLYYLGLKGWTTVFGRSVLSLRSFSVMLAGLSVALLYLLVTTATGRRSAGLVASLLLSLSGWHAALSQEARMYLFGTVFALLSTWLLLKATQSKRTELGWWLLYSLSVAALLYTHYYGFFTLAAQGCWVVGYILAATRLRVGEMLQWQLTWYALISFILVGVLFLPWLPTFVAQRSQVSVAFWIPAFTRWSIPDTLYRMLVSTAYGPARDTWLLTLRAITPALGVLVIWLWLLLRPYRREGERSMIVLLFLCALFPFVLSAGLSLFGQSIYQDRYLGFAYPFVLAGIAIVLSTIRPLLLRRLLIAASALSFAALTVRYFYRLDIAQHPGVHVASRAVYTQRQAAEPVIVSSSFVFFPVDHYAREEFKADSPRLFATSPDVAHFAGGPIIQPHEIVGPEIWQTKSVRSVWVVDTTGFGGSPLTPPREWKLTKRERFSEVFVYQGDILISRYQR